VQPQARISPATITASKIPVKRLFCFITDNLLFDSIRDSLIRVVVFVDAHR